MPSAPWAIETESAAIGYSSDLIAHAGVDVAGLAGGRAGRHVGQEVEIAAGVRRLAATVGEAEDLEQRLRQESAGERVVRAEAIEELIRDREGGRTRRRLDGAVHL